MNKLLSKLWFRLAVIILLVLIGLYLRPVPKVTATSQLPAMPAASNINLSWPAAGQAALGAEGYGLLASHGSSVPVPIGSTAKIITALAVLNQRPLTVGGQGPQITLSQTDVDSYNSYYSQDGSVTKVSAGEQISEYQALESLLLPSSNNMADTLANWAFGSKAAYLGYANQMVKDLGLTHTQVNDTNGFSDTTTSTADDLVKLGLTAINNPVLAQIVSQASADVPVAGIIKNTNILLGSDGIIGIKTGNTAKAGGNYVFATKRSIQGRQVTIVGAILDQPDLATAIQAAPALIKSSDTGFSLITLVHKDQALGFYKAPWRAKAEFGIPEDINLLVWKGAKTIITIQTNVIEPSRGGAHIGRLTVSNLERSASADLALSKNLPPPSPLWRVFR